jgi:hypothetical protein
MSIPEFTAEASLYRTTNRYRSSGSEFDGSIADQSVVAAYFPGTATQAKCNRCSEIALRNYGVCLGIGAIGCIASGPAYPICAGIALEGCNLELLGAQALCAYDDCCPKICGTPNPFDPGEGCCDANEQCVDRYDPNSRQGCCPSDQSVCAGKCCAKGESCCGDTCCPPNYFCRDGGFCSEFPSDLLPPPGTPGPPPPINNCIFGGEPCQGKCCPPGLVCCGGSPGQPDCKTSCLR